MIVFRPVGLEELRLIYEADLEGFPPRLPDQPIFHPVLKQPYAARIAKDWNTKTGTKAGFVTRFDVGDAYVARFERRVVGGQEHEELWVPAEELPTFNDHMTGPIQIVEAHFGDGYQGLVPDSFGLKGKTAHEQFVALARTLPHSGFDVACELAANHVAVFLNFFFWEREDFGADGIDAGERDRILGMLKAVWSQGQRAAFPWGWPGARDRRRIPMPRLRPASSGRHLGDRRPVPDLLHLRVLRLRVRLRGQLGRGHPSPPRALARRRWGLVRRRQEAVRLEPR
jgi:hypothetical protein